MTKILIPFDGSEAALHALEYLVSLRESFGEVLQRLDVQVLNVQEDVHIFGEHVTPNMLDSMRDELLVQARQVNREAVDYLSSHSVPCSPLEKIGDPSEQIVNTARELGCSNILMGTRGMGNFGNLLLGSVATKVIHNSELPVTLIKPTTWIN